jgi:putative NIF3 family GTP cyclohydrolase 1 type 2
VPGAGASVALAARAEGCEVFVTGEMKHHEVHAAMAAGLSVILGGHTATERGYLPTYAQLLNAQLPQAEFVVSIADRDPLELR